MKIAISCINEDGLRSRFDPRFGRASYFAIVKVDTMELSFTENTASQLSSGAGVKAAQLVSDQAIDGVISGKIGPKAAKGLKSAGIKIYYFNGDIIEEAIRELKKDSLIVEFDPGVKR